MNNQENCESIIQIKISLVGTDPEIFRRVLVYEDTKLNDLHKIIQAVMGWYNYHLHQFIKNKERYVTDPSYDSAFFCFRDTPEEKDESKFTISDLAPNTRSKFLYEYDFGDSWIHEIKREKTIKDIGELEHPMGLLHSELI